jgi:hypothetical protein
MRYAHLDECDVRLYFRKSLCGRTAVRGCCDDVEVVLCAEELGETFTIKADADDDDDASHTNFPEESAADGRYAPFRDSDPLERTDPTSSVDGPIAGTHRWGLKSKATTAWRE